MKRILIIGAGGQIGSELTVYLRKIYGDRNVVATDMRECKALGEARPFEVLNALDATAMASVVARYHIDSIFNLVALLSAVGERNPQMAWNVNMGASTTRSKWPASTTARSSRPARSAPSAPPRQGPDPAGYHHAAHDDLTASARSRAKCWATTTTTYTASIPARCVSGHYFERHAARRRHDDYAVEIYYEAIRSGGSPAPCRRTSIWT